jgi:hypothetical protein
VPSPPLSVVIPAVHGEAAAACLASLRACISEADGVEVVVVEPRAGAGLCALRADGIRLASAPRIALLSDTYEVTPQWLRAALQAGRYDILGGVVSPSPRLTYFGWCVYLSEYFRLAPPLPDGELRDPLALPGGNAVYRREVADPGRLAACQTEIPFHRQLLDAGASAGRDCALEVLYSAAPGAGAYLRERFWFSQAIARERGQVWRALLVPMLPLLLLIRTSACLGKGCRFALRWLAAVPVIAAFGLVQAAGEFSGCLGRK